MYDKYDSPLGEEELYEKNPREQAEEAIGKIKPLAAPAIAIIALLLLGFFAYDFFIGSVKSVTFRLNNTEGNPVGGGAVKILFENREEAARARNTETASLKTGSYIAEAIAPGYRSRSEAFSVTENQTVEIEMEIDKDLEIAGEFPGSFFTGEEKTLEITITNNSETTEAGLVLEGDAERALELSYDKPLTLIPGANTVRVSLKAMDNVSAGLIRAGNRGTIRIEGLNNRKAKIDGTFEILKFDQRDLSIRVGQSTRQADFGSVRSGSSSEKQITVENRSDAAVTDIEVSLAITSTTFADREEVLGWFSIEPSGRIDRINPGETRTMSLILLVPDSFAFPPGKTEEMVSGNITVKTSFYTQQFSLSLRAQKPDTGIRASGLGDKHTIRKTNGNYVPGAGFLEIRNTGDVQLTDFEVLVSCTEGFGWLYIEDNKTDTGFASLGAGQAKNIPYAIRVPNSVQSGKISNCRVRISYEDPASVEYSEELLTQILTG